LAGKQKGNGEMIMDQNSELFKLLRDIRQNQQTQLSGQQEALELQREQHEMAKHQFDRASQLQDRAERLQDSSAVMMRTARRLLAIILPLVVALVIYLGWLLLR
jgi:uncharacterized membrane protein (DUF106 family)